MLDAVLSQTRALVRAEESFCLLPELQLGHAAAQRLAQPPDRWDRVGQLTVLIGPHGSGKSLLARHAVRTALKRQRRHRFAYLSDAQLIHLLDDEPESRAALAALAQLDGLVLDDLDASVTSFELSDAVARLLDELAAHQVRVLITLAQAPAQCPQFTQRLVSRMHGGLTARLGALSVASRRQYLEWLAQQQQIALSADVLTWAAEQPPGQFQSLQEIIRRLTTEFPPPSRVNDLLSAQRVLLQSEQRVSLAVIAGDVAQTFGVTAQELRGKARNLACRLPRQCAMYLAHEVGGWPMSEIGRYFGRRTHASVSYSCRKFEDSLQQLPTLREQLQRLQSRLVERRSTDCG